MLRRFGGNSINKTLYVCLSIILVTLTFDFTKSDELERNSAVVTFSGISVASWNTGGKTTKFNNIVASVANGYCSSNYDECGLRFWNTSRVFGNLNIVKLPNYPKQVQNDVELRFYVTLPTGDDIRKPNLKVLPKSTLDGILEANSTQIASSVGAKMKSTTSDDSTPKPEVDNTLDYIMIPVGFGLLIFVIVLACCLHLCHKRKVEEMKKEERRQFFLRQKTESTKPESPFQAPVKQIPEVAVKPQPRQEPNLYHEDEQDGDPYIIEKEQVISTPPQTENEHKHEEPREHLYDKVDGSYSNKECGKNENEKEDPDPTSEESDYAERRHSKRKKKKKKRHSKRSDSQRHEDNEEYDSDVNPPPNILEDDISSRLPAPRKLPPLRTNNSYV